MSTPTKSRRKTAVQKRDGAAEPVVKLLAEPKSSAFPAGRMLIPSPNAVAAVINTVPAGRLLTLSALRRSLALTYGADYTCPITTGIFLRIVADAAEEERMHGARSTTPWWRVVRDDGTLFIKLPGGVKRHAESLESEGIEVVRVRRIPTRVVDVASHQWTPT